VLLLDCQHEQASPLKQRLTRTRKLNRRRPVRRILFCICVHLHCNTATRSRLARKCRSAGVPPVMFVKYSCWRRAAAETAAPLGCGFAALRSSAAFRVLRCFQWNDITDSESRSDGTTVAVDFSPRKCAGEIRRGATVESALSAAILKCPRGSTVAPRRGSDFNSSVD
jgi:hypothetical protein